MIRTAVVACKEVKLIFSEPLHFLFFRNSHLSGSLALVLPRGCTWSRATFVGGMDGRHTGYRQGWGEGGKALHKQSGWLGKAQLSHFLWEVCRMHLPPVWEPHRSLLKLQQNVEVFSAQQEWTFLRAGFAGLVLVGAAVNLRTVLPEKGLDLLEEIEQDPVKPGA